MSEYANELVRSELMLTALRAASGYLMNARIDLSTGVTKKRALATIDRGLKAVNAAIAKAETMS